MTDYTLKGINKGTTHTQIPVKQFLIYFTPKESTLAMFNDYPKLFNHIPPKDYIRVCYGTHLTLEAKKALDEDAFYDYTVHQNELYVRNVDFDNQKDIFERCKTEVQKILDKE